MQDAAKYDLETFRTFNLGAANKSYLLNSAQSPQCAGRTCTCVDSGSELSPIGGVGTTTLVPSYFSTTTYALSGKRECFYSDSAQAKFETTNELYATYVKFDTREEKYDFKILDEASCR